MVWDLLPLAPANRTYIGGGNKKQNGLAVCQAKDKGGLCRGPRKACDRTLQDDLVANDLLFPPNLQKD